MPYVLIIHDVEDYPRWKQVFDDAAELRAAAGESDYQLLSHTDDARRIVHFSRWTSVTDARSFFESPELVDIRKKAGVLAPEFHYLDELESGRVSTPE